MRTLTLERHEKRWVKRHPTCRICVQLRHPAADALRIELCVPAGVERIAHIHATAIPTDLYHLGTAIERSACRMRRMANDATEADRAGELWMEGVTDIVLPKLTSAPAGDIQIAIIQGEIDVCYQRRHCAEGL